VRGPTLRKIRPLLVGRLLWRRRVGRVVWAVSAVAAVAAGRGASVMTALRAAAARSGRFVRQLPSPLPWLLALADSVRRRAPPLASRAVAAVTGWIAVATSARPVRILTLSLAALAAGGLGLMVAYAATPDGLDEQILVTNGETYTIATVTGAGGTTTVAVAKTKEGKRKLIPVRVTRTVDGPGDTEKVFVDVVGEPIVLRETDTRLITQIATQVATQTDVETQFQPVTQTQVVTETHVVTESETKTDTVVVTETVIDAETVVVTETKEITVTEAVPP
jgi:hypothetical protein